MPRPVYILLPQDDFAAMTALLHDVKFNIAQLEASYHANEISRKLEAIEQILNGSENDQA